MIRTLTLKAAVLTCLALALLLRLKIDDVRITAARDRAASSALPLANATAERDSTRDLAATNRRVATPPRDSLRLVERQGVQVSQRADALDRALRDERIEHATIRTTVDSLRRVAFAETSLTPPSVNRPIADSAHAVRRATFNIRQSPYTVVADA